MSSEFLSVARTVLLSMVGSSVIGALCYAFCRQINIGAEKSCFSRAIAVALIGLTSVPLSIFAGTDPRHFCGVMIFLACCCLGAEAHRKTSRPSETWLGSVGLILTAAVISGVVGSVIIAVSPLPSYGPMSPAQKAFLDSFLIGLMIYPVLSPVGLLVWQNFRIKPGVDEPFGDNAS